MKAKGVNEYPIIMAWSQKEGAFPEAWTSMVFAQHEGGNALFDADLNPVFNIEGSAAFKVMEWLRKAYADGLIDPASLSMAEIDQVKSMQAGAHAFTIVPQYNMAELNKPGSGEFRRPVQDRFDAWPKPRHRWLCPLLCNDPQSCGSRPGIHRCCLQVHGLLRRQDRWSSTQS